MSADFDVRAQLTLDSRGAFTGAQRLSSSMATLGQQLSGAQGMAGGLVGRLMGVGAAYLGLNAGIGVFKGLTHSAVSYTSELEATKIGLQSILQSVEGGSWDEAGKKAEMAFEKIKQASIASPASAQEMFGIFTGILGPIEGAGFGMEKVVSMTNSAVLAASALNVDYAQASRDISMMARGAAGVDVKLFSLLRSTNAIKETTEQWNKNLTAAQRVEKLSAALAKFDKSGEAFGKSWKGVTSTFQGVWQEASRAFMSPIMAMGARKIGAANDYLIKNQEKTAYLFQLYGGKVAGWIEQSWDRGVSGAKWVAAHWGEITQKIDNAMIRVHAIAPMLLKAAEIYAAVSMGASVAGKGLQIGAGAIGAGGMAASGLSKMVGGAAWLGKGIVGTTSAAGSTGAGAAVAAEGAAAGTTAAGAAAAAAALPAVAIGLVAVAGAAPIVADNWGVMSKSVTDITGNMWQEMVAAGRRVWQVIQPAAMIVGHLFTTLGWVLLNGVAIAVRAVTTGISWLADTLTPMANLVTNELVPGFRAWWQELEQTSKMVGRFFDSIGLTDPHAKLLGHLPGAKAGEQADIAASLKGGFDWARQKETAKNLAKQKTTVHNDFRGSQIKIDQKFDGDADPDRIVVGMMQDLTRQAEMRLSSGYASPFSR
jgi:hypothetical protein